MQTMFTQSNQKESREKRSGNRWGMVTLMKLSSLVLLSCFLLQPWYGLEKVPCFNEHAMIQGWKKPSRISDACLFQSRFGCPESLPQVQSLVQEESNPTSRHFLDFDVVWPSWQCPRVNNPLPPLHSPSFFAAKRQESETCESIHFFTKAPGYQLLYSDTWLWYGR